MNDLIHRQDVLALAKDVILINGAKHRCIDATQIHELPSAEPNILDDGTLTITVPHGLLSKVGRVIVDEVGTKFCKMMYQDALPSAEPEVIRCKDCIWHLKDDSCARLYCITDDDFYCWHGRREE